MDAVAVLPITLDVTALYLASGLNALAVMAATALVGTAVHRLLPRPAGR